MNASTFWCECDNSWITFSGLVPRVKTTSALNVEQHTSFVQSQFKLLFSYPSFHVIVLLTNIEHTYFVHYHFAIDLDISWGIYTQAFSWQNSIGTSAFIPKATTKSVSIRIWYTKEQTQSINAINSFSNFLLQKFKIALLSASD